MSLSPYWVGMLLVLVLPATAWTQPGGLERAAGTRQIDLSQMPRPELWVAPGQSTLVLLDAPLDMPPYDRSPRLSPAPEA